MTGDISGRDLERVAARVVLRLEGLISVMRYAADRVCEGRPLQEIPVGGYQLYLAEERVDGADRSWTRAIVFALDLSDYARLLEKAAREEGICLEDEAEIEVTVPEAEFGEDLVTGGFSDFVGVAVRHRNTCQEELALTVAGILEKRGLRVACIPDEDVILWLPLPEGVRDRGAAGA